MNTRHRRIFNAACGWMLTFAGTAGALANAGGRIYGDTLSFDS